MEAKLKFNIITMGVLVVLVHHILTGTMSLA